MCNTHIYFHSQSGNKNVSNAHNSEILRELHTALIDVVDEINRPRRDDRLIEEAGIPLDRALFPLLARIGRYGPIGVVELADRTGRDHTTVSRQMTKLEDLGLIERRASATDKRVREASVSERGGEMIALLNAARERLANRILANWTEADLDQLRVLLRRFADDLMR
jgi:DNA-binding MarR family transcriptional regulator